MTDNFEKDINVPSKQIIIDGVDVSECDELYINKANTIICEITGYLCEDRQNCYYKQLKREEQECDMWKNLTVDNGAVALKYQQQIDQLKAELEQEQALKETYLACYKAKHEDIEGIFFTLRQTLQDVREMASKFDYWNNNLSQASRVLNEIVDRINEVLDE